MFVEFFSLPSVRSWLETMAFDPFRLMYRYSIQCCRMRIDIFISPLIRRGSHLYVPYSITTNIKWTLVFPFFKAWSSDLVEVAEFNVCFAYNTLLVIKK